MVAWQMYADENRGMLPPNESGIPGEYTASKSWIDGWLTYNPKTFWNTNEDYLVSPLHATLAAYIHDPKIYRCPSDPTKLGGVNRVRSVSMNQAMGMSAKALAQRADKSWNIITQDAAKPGEKYYKVYEQSSQLDQPSSRWVFIDEHPDSINDGSFCIILPQVGKDHYWWDLPASTHANGSALTFADGHAERHQWKVGSTLMSIKAKKMERGFSANGEDFDWLAERTTTTLGVK